MGPLPATPAQVAEWLPHRAPMLLVDSVVAADAASLTAQRTFRADEFFFQGHFPGEPILPGVILLEALAQAAALHTGLSKQLRAAQVAYRFSKVESVTWAAPVRPDQTVTLQVTKLREKLGFLQFTAVAKVADTVVCDANFTAKVMPR
ncbi:MAG: 3-hydroxyacyl-ACP dehydratase FabZ [Alphaproteobacteria bacterium]|nr:3-hydroxyacyl-ACP dehydratase FabZ [Alphaproteobacteria bacterium]